MAQVHMVRQSATREKCYVESATATTTTMIMCVIYRVRESINVIRVENGNEMVYIHSMPYRRRRHRNSKI